MLIAIDIDGTIAIRNMPAFAKRCNEQLRLGIDETRCNTLMYRDFLIQPELLAYKERVGELWFQRNLAWIDLEADVLLAMRPMPGGTLAGIRRLAELGNIAYYTARKAAMPHLLERNEPMAQATRQWLARYDFPGAEHVVFCVGASEKLSKLAEIVAKEPQHIVLIDDNAAKLIEAYPTLDPRSADLLRTHLTLVAFRDCQVPAECHDLSIVSLASWRDIETIIDHLKGVSHDHDCNATTSAGAAGH